MLPTVACLKIKLLKFSITYDIIQQRQTSNVLNPLAEQSKPKKKLLTLEKSLNKEMGFALCPEDPQSDLGYMCSFLVYVSLGTDFKHI